MTDNSIEQLIIYGDFVVRNISKYSLHLTDFEHIVGNTKYKFYIKGKGYCGDWFLFKSINDNKIYATNNVWDCGKDEKLHKRKGHEEYTDNDGNYYKIYKISEKDLPKYQYIDFPKNTRINDNFILLNKLEMIDLIKFKNINHDKSLDEIINNAIINHNIDKMIENNTTTLINISSEYDVLKLYYKPYNINSKCSLNELRIDNYRYEIKYGTFEYGLCVDVYYSLESVVKEIIRFIPLCYERYKSSIWPTHPEEDFMCGFISEQIINKLTENGLYCVSCNDPEPENKSNMYLLDNKILQLYKMKYN